LTFQRKVSSIYNLELWIQRIGFRTENGIRKDLEKIKKTVPRKYMYRVGVDPDCIEIPTKILTSWSDAKRSIQAILDGAKKTKLIAKNQGLSTGGGGHVHLSGMNLLTKYAIVRDMQNRPYVPWFFADPDTTQQCNSINVNYCYSLVGCRWEKIVKYVREGNAPFHLWMKNYHTNIHIALNTIEFRFFDCFMDYEQYEESLAFAQAYASWIAGRVNKGKKFEVKIKNRTSLLKQYNDFDKCLKEFRKLITDIGLPWERYQKYTANLEERFTDIDLLT